ncbi:DUF2628 domain-containing protein [Notoacmeibacter marinus]|uniref:DUF2628 domain-containing protein n=1 Tax=Notoacmeibacter marinus TaxID=1876515 RepID=UPI0013B063E5|nr:DUF2628 domain-containing protein [Notoacmeibacter marinus]
MRVYRVMERQVSADEPVETRFIAERFRWLAFLLPVVWLLFQRLWLTAFLVLALGFALGLALPRLGFGEGYVLICGLALGLIVGLESTGLIVSGLEKRGWHEVGAATGDTIEDAETRWFAGRSRETNPADHSPLAGAPV